MEIPSFLVVSISSLTVFVVFLMIEVACYSWIMARNYAKKGSFQGYSKIEDHNIKDNSYAKD